VRERERERVYTYIFYRYIPVSNLAISNTPIGPFQMMVLDDRIACPGIAIALAPVR